MNSLLDIGSWLSIATISLAIGLISFFVLRNFSLLVRSVIVVVLTIFASAPLLVAFAFNAPKPFESPSQERQLILVVRVFASSASGNRYDPRDTTPTSSMIPNHLEARDLVGQASIYYMAELPIGEPPCISVSQSGIMQSMRSAVLLDSTILDSRYKCKPFPGSPLGYTVLNRQTGLLQARVLFPGMLKHLSSLEKPWQLQIAINGGYLTEDARGYEKWRNVRDAPYLRIVTLSRHRKDYAEGDIRVDVASGQINFKIRIVRPRTISEDSETLVLYIIYPFTLLFISGLGWFLVVRLCRRGRA